MSNQTRSPRLVGVVTMLTRDSSSCAGAATRLPGCESMSNWSEVCTCASLTIEPAALMSTLSVRVWLAPLASAPTVQMPVAGSYDPTVAETVDW